MTRQKDVTAMEEVLELICQNGLDGLNQAIAILINEAMKIERTRAIQADPYERTANRQGYANDFKPKTLKTRIGEIVDRNWTEIPDHFPNIVLDEYVIMPNHFHGILIIKSGDRENAVPERAPASDAPPLSLGSFEQDGYPRLPISFSTSSRISQDLTTPFIVV